MNRKKWACKYVHINVYLDYVSMLLNKYVSIILQHFPPPYFPYFCLYLTPPTTSSRRVFRSILVFYDGSYYYTVLILLRALLNVTQFSIFSFPRRDVLSCFFLLLVILLEYSLVYCLMEKNPHLLLLLSFFYFFKQISAKSFELFYNYWTIFVILFVFFLIWL